MKNKYLKILAICEFNKIELSINQKLKFAFITQDFFSARKLLAKGGNLDEVIKWQKKIGRKYLSFDQEHFLMQNQN